MTFKFIYLLFKDFIYLRVKERERVSEREYESGEGQREKLQFTFSDVGLHPGTTGSRPEMKAVT